MTDDTKAIDRAKIIEDNKKEIIKKCETSDEVGVQSKIFLVVRLINLKMVLKLKKTLGLVYAPPAYIGEYGGEIDNWMYPRHTGDFALLRAYTAKDGSSKYDEDNIPYKSDSFLKVSAKGVDEDDFVMVVGYPGRTNRTITFNEIEWDLKIGFQRP